MVRRYAIGKVGATVHGFNLQEGECGVRAGSKSSRRKAGRPRIEGAERYPGGQVNHKWREDHNEKDAQSVAIKARKRVHGLKEKDAKSQHAGSVLGRIFIDEKITDAQREAGERFAEDMARYYALYGLPFPSARAQNIFSVKGFGGEESESKVDAAKKVTSKILAINDELVKRPNYAQVKSTLFNVCVMDYDHLRAMPDAQFAYLRAGLRALIWFYGVNEN